MSEVSHRDGGTHAPERGLEHAHQSNGSESVDRVEPAAPIRVLFVHARDNMTPDLAVHFMLMRHFDPAKTRASVITNSQASDLGKMERASAATPRLSAYYLALGIPDEHLQNKGRLAKMQMATSMAVSLLRASRLVRRNKIDIIHATDRPRDVLVSTLLAKLTGRANVIHLHTNGDAYRSRLILWGFREATKLVAVSAFTRQEAIELGVPEHKIVAAHNATDPAYFDPALFSEARRSARGELGFTDDDFLVGITARVIPWKGQKELINAVALLKSKHPNLRLIIVGGCADSDADTLLTAEEMEMRRCIQELNVKENVRFAGRFADVRPFLSALDVFALPSYAEPFGLAITEAMAMELPTIACNTGGVPEIIEHLKQGYLVEPRSAPAVAEAIQFMMAHPDKRREMGRQARLRVQQRFTPSRQADQISGIYTEIAAGARRAKKERQ